MARAAAAWRFRLLAGAGRRHYSVQGDASFRGLFSSVLSDKSQDSALPKPSCDDDGSSPSFRGIFSSPAPPRSVDEGFLNEDSPSDNSSSRPFSFRTEPTKFPENANVDVKKGNRAVKSGLFEGSKVANSGASKDAETGSARSTLSEDQTSGMDPLESNRAAGKFRGNPNNRPLVNGLDPGIYKAIMVGKVGQMPIVKRLKTGRKVVLFSLATGGMRSHRRPLEGEKPADYAEQNLVQWHRVCIYPDALGNLALKQVKSGAMLYLEGNLETKVFSDPETGLVRRIREIAIRTDGRIVFLSSDDSASQLDPRALRGVGYF